jgi:hypothetical protein
MDIASLLPRGEPQYLLLVHVAGVCSLHRAWHACMHHVALKCIPALMNSFNPGPI